MAKIIRKLQKLFGSSISGGVGQFGSAQLGTKVKSTDLDTIQNLSAWLNGWNDATISGEKLPPLEEFDGLAYVFSHQLKYIFQEGIPEYLSTEEYHVNSMVKKAGTNEIYSSKITPNTGKALGSKTSNVNWRYLGDLTLLRATSKYYIEGFVAKSGTTPDEQIDMTKGKALCQDGFTFVELPSDATDIDFPTLNGGALSNNTTYYLFRYRKNDNTDQWHLSTSLTPTISDILSANAYRRVFSAKTDSTGDLPDIEDSMETAHGSVYYKYKNPISATTTPPTAPTSVVLPAIPIGLKINVFINQDANQGIIYLGDGGSSSVYETGQNNTTGAGVTHAGWAKTDTSGQIIHDGSSIGVYGLNVIAFEDFRNYF